MRYLIFAIMLLLTACATASPDDLRAQADSARRNADALESQARSIERRQREEQERARQAAIQAAIAATQAAIPTATPRPIDTPVPTATPTPAPTETPSATAAPLVIVPTVVVYVTVNPARVEVVQPARAVSASEQIAAMSLGESTLIVLGALALVVGALVVVWRVFLTPRTRIEPND